jgi:hypothetical protein
MNYIELSNLTRDGFNTIYNNDNNKHINNNKSISDVKIINDDEEDNVDNVCK